MSGGTTHAKALRWGQSSEAEGRSGKAPSWAEQSVWAMVRLCLLFQEGQQQRCPGVPPTGALVVVWAHLCPSPRSLLARWHPEIGQGGSIYTTEIGRCDK